jgi:hypothetical protein
MAQLSSWKVHQGTVPVRFIPVLPDEVLLLLILHQIITMALS